MKKNGFTLVEILAVLVILGILLALSIPAYTSILTGVKRDNYNSKITEMEIAANKHGEKIKDEVKDAGRTCYNQEISYLVRKGYLLSESDYEDVILDPITNKAFTETIKICYCSKIYEIKSYYVENFENSKFYHEEEKVLHNGKIYICKHDYPGNKENGINSTYRDEKHNKTLPYFEEVSC